MPIPTENNSPGQQPSGGNSVTDNASSLDIAVLLITFKRLEETKGSFAQIRRARPARLYISGDGPRRDRAGEVEKVQETRDYVINNIDWECEVKTLFREENLGCRRGNSSAIDWFFENEAEGIVIEDDVVVSDSFFPFAYELLNYYRDDSRIMAITAQNHQDNQRRGEYSYYFSQINHCHGWASWRSAWKKYRQTEKLIPRILNDIKIGNLPGFTHNELANFMWQYNLMRAINSAVDSWAYIWTITVLVNSGLTCTPNTNLSKHIGYGDDSTHIKEEPQFLKSLKCNELSFPLKHPPYIVYNKDADDYTYRKVFFIDNFKAALEQQKAQAAAARAQQAEAQAANYPKIFQNNGGLKVLIISSKDSGGAGGAARRLHEAILRQGADSVMLVLDKQTNTPHIAEIEQHIPNLDRSKPSAQLFYAFNIIQQRLNNYPQRNNLEMFTTTESIVNYTELAPFIQQADIINVHWIDGFFDYQNAPKAFAGKHIVWTLHDMYQFTGGCHHAFDCNNYITGCKGCPQMGAADYCEMTQTSHNIKLEAYNNLNISFTAPSHWLENCAQKSLLMQGMESRVIPNIFDINKFKPVNQEQARTQLKLPADKAIILFGADSLLRPVKNLKTLLNCLNELCAANTIHPDNFVLVVFGAGNLQNINTPYRIIELGVLNSAEEMSLAYSAADFTAIPSLIESFSYLKCESLACGTPIIGFTVGGMPYLIENKVNGYLAAPFSTAEFKDALLWGLHTAKNNAEIRNNCRKIIEENLNEPLVAGNIIDFYTHIAAQPIQKIPEHTNTSISIPGNHPLRTRYLNTLLNTNHDSMIQTATSFSTEISNWLNQTLLPHRNLTAEELNLKQKCLQALTTKSPETQDFLQALLLSIVLIPAEELPVELNIYNQPREVHNLLSQYIFTFKELPAGAGFTETTYRNMTAYLGYLQHAVETKPESASELIMNAFNTLRKITVYCAQGGLKELMTLSAKMMRELLLRNNAQVDYTFAPRNENRKIRLGILLQAFSEHTETYATLPAFTHLDKTEYEIFAFVLKITHSQQELQYRDCYDQIIEISPTQIPHSVSQIREADLDILLIGTNITALANHNALISTHRLARIQAVHFCNPCTTGIENIDYFITSSYFSLQAKDFTEQLILTKNSSICFEGNTIVKPATLALTRENLGIPENSIAFVTGANFYKFTWELREFWAKLLEAVPNSYLVTYPFGPAWTDKYPVNEFNTEIHQQFTEHNIEASRLIILKPLPTREDVRQAVGLCDIYLDSFPYSGATSLLDPLYTAIPMICMRTESVRGGQGSGMLEDIGLNELIAQNETEYLAIAVKLAQDPVYRQRLSTIIQEKMQANPAFLDTASYCRDMDRIYKQMLAAYAAKSHASAALPEATSQNSPSSNSPAPKLKPNDLCSCGSGLKYKKCCGK